MHTFVTEYQEDDSDKCVLRDSHHDLAGARSHARRLTRKSNLLVYVMACDDDDVCVGAEVYACGRRSHADCDLTAFKSAR